MTLYVTLQKQAKRTFASLLSTRVLIGCMKKNMSAGGIFKWRVQMSKYNFPHENWS